MFLPSQLIFISSVRVKGNNTELDSAVTEHLTLAGRVLLLAGSISCRSEERNRLFTKVFFSWYESFNREDFVVALGCY